MKSLLSHLAMVGVSALALAGCATVAPSSPTPPTGAAYRALGTEPFWSVGIENSRMTYESAEGLRVSADASAPRTTFNGHRYESEQLVVDVTHKRCSDGMSDRLYADTVMVMVGGQTLHGCGGEIISPAELAGTHWAITAIDDTAVSGADYFLNFAADRLNGKAGCNGFSGAYSERDRILTAGDLVSTRMACPADRMAHEARTFEILREPVRLDHRADGTLIVRGSAGSLTLRRSV